MKTPIDIDHVCRLANLKLTPSERSKLRSQMGRIIHWVDRLNDLSDELEKAHPFMPDSLTLRLYDDKVDPSYSNEHALSNAPSKEKGFIKVPKVIEK